MELLDLPVEILFIICEHMNPHYILEFAENDMPLYQTSKTCRRLGYIAQQVLYHDVKPKKYGLFLRTIIDQPKLAARVRRFEFDYWWLLWTPLSDGQVEQLQATAKSLNIAQSMYSQIRNLESLGKGHRWATIQDNFLYLRLVELSMALLPNIKMLQVRMPDMYASDEMQHPHILTASVQMEFINHIEFDTGWLLNLDSTKNFFAMMPYLETLDMVYCGKITEPLPFPRIRSLSMTVSCISERSLQTLISSCPRLEYFRYESSRTSNFWIDDEPHFTYGQAQRILHSRRTTLKLFKVKCVRPHRDTGHPLASDSCDSFCDFTRLETLRLQIVCFGTEDEDDKRLTPKFPADLQDLVAKLPMSLISITFSGPHKDWKGIEVLAEALQKGYFPRLKKVHVQQTLEEYKMSGPSLLAAYSVKYTKIEW